jgi:hypothetical protein
VEVALKVGQVRYSDHDRLIDSPADEISHRSKNQETQKVSQELPAEFGTKIPAVLSSRFKFVTGSRWLRKNLLALITAHRGQRDSGMCVLERRFHGQKCLSKA